MEKAWRGDLGTQGLLGRECWSVQPVEALQVTNEASPEISFISPIIKLPLSKGKSPSEGFQSKHPVGQLSSMCLCSASGLSQGLQSCLGATEGL